MNVVRCGSSYSSFASDHTDNNNACIIPYNDLVTTLDSRGAQKRRFVSKPDRARRCRASRIDRHGPWMGKGSFVSAPASAPRVVFGKCCWLLTPKAISHPARNSVAGRPTSSPRLTSEFRGPFREVIDLRIYPHAAIPGADREHGTSNKWWTFDMYETRSARRPVRLLIPYSAFGPLKRSHLQKSV